MQVIVTSSGVITPHFVDVDRFKPQDSIPDDNSRNRVVSDVKGEDRAERDQSRTRSSPEPTALVSSAPTTTDNDIFRVLTTKRSTPSVLPRPSFHIFVLPHINKWFYEGYTTLRYTTPPDSDVCSCYPHQYRYYGTSISTPLSRVLSQHNCDLFSSSTPELLFSISLNQRPSLSSSAARPRFRLSPSASPPT